MVIDPDVAAVAKQWSNSDAFARLIQSVVNAEGNILRAVQISIPTVATREQALEVTCRSATHAMADFLLAQTMPPSANSDAFVKFWAARWAPQGVANDPTGLNRFWSGNVFNGWVGDAYRQSKTT